jgi:hypothetical protein
MTQAFSNPARALDLEISEMTFNDIIESINGRKVGHARRRASWC